MILENSIKLNMSHWIKKNNLRLHKRTVEVITFKGTLDVITLKGTVDVIMFKGTV